MWLLSTNRAELHFFDDQSKVPGGYAILSHTWDGDEKTFQYVRDLQLRCAQSKENPRDLVSPKIRNCCELAEREGYYWVWIDTCCIDKTSSSELSEAINSMFRVGNTGERGTRRGNCLIGRLQAGAIKYNKRTKT